MKKLLFFALLVAGCLVTVLFSCSQEGQNIHKVTVGDVTIQNGDLLFVGLPMSFRLTDSTSMDKAILDATGSGGEVNYIHVSILEVDEHDSLWVIDATIKHGVDRHPFEVFLSDFTLKDGSYPQLVVMRLWDNANVNSYVDKAKTYCGCEYDLHFLPDNDAQYCSELVRNSYTTSTGFYIFGESPMNFKDAEGEFPPYWVELFELLGEPVPQGVMGTNPQEMSQEQCLKRVGEMRFDN